MFFSLSKNTGGVAAGGDHSVFTVDTHTTRPPVPPRLGDRRRHSRAAETLLFLLVSLALAGLLIEACFIYRLYIGESASTPSTQSQTADDTFSSTNLKDGFQPSKPVAHLTDGQIVKVDGKNIMAWSTVAEPILYGMNYSNGNLIILKEGYYYVYSKVYFSSTRAFNHIIKQDTERYAGKAIPLLQARKYSNSNHKNQHTDNSYLGGVFHLYENDKVFVYVNNISEIIRHHPYENVFGMYML